MIQEKIFLPVDLRLFDGGAAAAGTGTAAAAGGEGAAAGGDTAAAASAEGAKEAKAEATKSPAAEAAERQKAFREALGPYRDLYDAELDRAARRGESQLRALRQQAEAMRPLLDTLAARYGVEADPARLAEELKRDGAFWAEAAEKAGMTVEQYRKLSLLERERNTLLARQRRQQEEAAAEARMRAWETEGEALKAKYPEFDLENECGNPEFISMLRHGASMETAYQALHMQEMIGKAVSAAVAETERAVVENVRARGARPAENGAQSQGAFTMAAGKDLSRADRAALARRALRGEKISL